jgi:hypothetical protein
MKVDSVTMYCKDVPKNYRVRSCNYSWADLVDDIDVSPDEKEVVVTVADKRYVYVGVPFVYSFTIKEHN